MPTLDVFKADAFSMTSLTTSINRAVYQPGRIGRMGLFKKQGIPTTDVQIERMGNTISLLPSKTRGSKGTIFERDKRKVRTFNVPHIPHDAEILAASIQNLRAFGSQTELDAVSSHVNGVLDRMRQNHEVTHEFYRIGAIKGVLLDGDGATTLIDLFSEFGISEQSVDFLLGTTTTKLKSKCETVLGYMDDALGNLSYSGVQAFCGQTFWEKLIVHTDFEKAYERDRDGAVLRSMQRGSEGDGEGEGIEFGGIHWQRYRGKVGSTHFVPLADCRFVPLGVNDLFTENYAPADFMDTVNTEGQAVYVAQEPMPFNKGVNVHTQSNPVMLCNIPEVLIRGTTSN